MRAFVPALVAVLAFPIAASATPLPSWLDVTTGPGGYAVNLVAEVTTLTITAGGFTVDGTAPASFDLPGVTRLVVSMSFASPCEFEVGCIISAPLDFTVSGLPGELTVFGFPLYLNGDPLTWDLNPAGTPNGRVSGAPQHFTSGAGFTDNTEWIAIAGEPVPEPAALAVLGIGLLGLAGVRRRA